MHRWVHLWLHLHIADGHCLRVLWKIPNLNPCLRALRCHHHVGVVRKYTLFVSPLSFVVWARRGVVCALLRDDFGNLLVYDWLDCGLYCSDLSSNALSFNSSMFSQYKSLYKLYVSRLFIVIVVIMTFFILYNFLAVLQRLD